MQLSHLITYRTRIRQEILIWRYVMGGINQEDYDREMTELKANHTSVQAELRSAYKSRVHGHLA